MSGAQEAARSGYRVKEQKTMEVRLVEGGQGLCKEDRHVACAACNLHPGPGQDPIGADLGYRPFCTKQTCLITC